MLRFTGCAHFRQRLLLSTLSGRAIRIDDIRAGEQSPGLRDFEASLLRLLEKLTNGCVVEINETGTSLRYRPGVIICGGGLVHDCGAGRSIGYYLEALVLLALFAKKPLSITLRGVTNDHLDPSVDLWRTVGLPLLRKAAGLDDAGLELKIVRRGARPAGGGEVALRVPLVRALPPVSLTDEGMVRRVRGIAYSMRVPPANANRMVDAARGVLNALLADVYIFTDAAGGGGGGSPGYGITLVAETTSGCLLSAEAAATQGARGAGGGGGGGDAEEPLVVPEDIGRAAAQLLLDEVARGGVADGTHQGLLLLLAALGPEEMNCVRLGPLTPYAVRTLRHVKEFLGVTFSMRTEAASGTIYLSCVGAGLKNINRKVT
ncbi:RCL1 [Scenedesmus sp. PABB004]|nr:RCL1 [Scenedesmus sp. PABB004]